MSLPESSELARTVAIVGLGPAGRALGQALARVRTNYRILGHDRDPERVRSAAQAGAIDQGKWNLPDTVAGADLVILAEPLPELLATLDAVAPHLAAGVLVTDTASLKLPVLRAAERLLPAGVSFVGGHPVLRAGGDQAGSPLVGATYCLVPLPSASDAALRVMASLVEAIGARPLFIDAAEHDALAAAVVELPEIVGAALLAMLARSPSSRDLLRLAGPAFPDRAGLSEEGLASLPASLLENAPAVTAWLDQLIAGLGAFREALETRDGPGIEALLSAAAAARAGWSEAPGADPAAQVAAEELKDYNPLRQMLFGRRPRRPSA